MTWIKVSKPVESSVTTLSGGGEPIGLLMSLTQTTSGTSVVSGWTSIVKPTTSTYTFIQKPVSSIWTFVAKPTS